MSTHGAPLVQSKGSLGPRYCTIVGEAAQGAFTEAVLSIAADPDLDAMYHPDSLQAL